MGAFYLLKKLQNWDKKFCRSFKPCGHVCHVGRSPTLGQVRRPECTLWWVTQLWSVGVSIGHQGYWAPRMPALCGPPVGTGIFSTKDVPHRWGHGFLIGIFPIGGDTSSSLGRKWGLCTLLARKNAQSPGLDPSITHPDLRPTLKAHLGGVDSIFWCCKILLTWTNWIELQLRKWWTYLVF